MTTLFSLSRSPSGLDRKKKENGFGRNPTKGEGTNFYVQGQELGRGEAAPISRFEQKKFTVVCSTSCPRQLVGRGEQDNGPGRSPTKEEKANLFVQGDDNPLLVPALTRIRVHLWTAHSGEATAY